MSVPYEVQGLGDTWSAPVSPWGTRCPNMPTKEWLENAGFLDLNQVNLPPLYEEGNYPSADLPEGAAWTHWSMPLNEAQVARLTGAMAILQTSKSDLVIEQMGLAIPFLSNASGSVREWMQGRGDSNLRVGRTVDATDTTAVDLDDYLPFQSAGSISFTPRPNPYWTIAYSGNGGIAGMYLPDLDQGSFTFPLVWSTALVLDHGPGVGGADILSVAWLSETLKQAAVDKEEWVEGSSRTLLEDLDALADAVRGQDFEAPGLGAVPGVLGTISAVWDWLIVGLRPQLQLLALDVTRALQTGLDTFANALEGAKEEQDLAASIGLVVDGFVGILDPMADEVDARLAPAAYLLGDTESGLTLRNVGASIRSVEEGALFGLSEEKASQFTTALREGGTEDVPAVIHLSSAKFDYYFDDFEVGYHPDEENLGTFAGYARTKDASLDPAWTRWIRTASPIIQYAFSLDLAADLLAQMFNAHSALLAVTDLLSIEGSVGAAIRSFLEDAELSCLEEILNGRGGGWVVAQLWKQAMVDLLLSAWEEQGGELDCLHDVFCWMGTSEQREHLDLMLGPAVLGVRGYSFLASLGANGGEKLCQRWGDADCNVREAFAKVVADWSCLPALFDDAAWEEYDGTPPVNSATLFPRDPVVPIEEPTLPHSWVPSFVDDLQLDRTFVPLVLDLDIRIFLKKSYVVPKFLSTDLPW